MKLYKIRRNLFFQLLNEQFSDVFSFETPKGGMAV
jgi:GntR family transcriptional regulator/MocR family aminotransferase